MDFEKLIRQSYKGVVDAPTELRYLHNRRIFEKFLATINESKREIDGRSYYDEPLFFDAVLRDFELFCLVHIRLDNRLPCYTAPWWTEATDIVEGHAENLFIECRKIGKSAWLTSYVLWKSCSDEGLVTVIFAPTEEQLYIMKDIIKCIKASQYIKDEFVWLHRNVHEKGKLNQNEITFPKNGSSINAYCLALQQDSDTKRGSKGSLIIVDEIGLVTKEARLTVIDDLAADAYTEKKQILVGTPKLIANPELENEWLLSLENDEVGTHHTTIWRGVEEGCITLEHVKGRFRKLMIPCPWGLEEGVCKPHELYIDKDGIEWKCDKCCRNIDYFVAENLGEFPQTAGRFIPAPYLEAAAVDVWPWLEAGEMGKAYIISVDYGLFKTPAQILVWEDMGRVLKLVAWEEFKVSTEPKGESLDYDPIIDAIKGLYQRFNNVKVGCRVLKIYPDATTIGMQITAQLTKGVNPVPKRRIYCNETAEKKGYLGVWVTGPFKHVMMQNYKEMLAQQRLLIPRRDPFWTKFKIENSSLQVNKTEGAGGYLKFKEGKGVTMDLVDATALAALHLSKDMNKSPPYLGVVYRHGR